MMTNRIYKIAPHNSETINRFKLSIVSGGKNTFFYCDDIKDAFWMIGLIQEAYKGDK